MMIDQWIQSTLEDLGVQYKVPGNLLSLIQKDRGREGGGLTLILGKLKLKDSKYGWGVLFGGLDFIIKVQKVE